MKAILGECVQLHSATARVTLPGEKDQELAPRRALARRA